MMNSKAIVAIIAALAAGTGHAHTQTVRWPHEGRLYHDGGTYVQADYLWHQVPGGFKTSDRFLELDLDIPNNYYKSCTGWSNMPNWYSDCGTANVAEGYAPSSDSRYNALGVGSWFPDRVVPNTWYQTRYTLSNKVGTSTQGLYANFGWQETYRYYCPDMSIWCLNGWEGGRVHSGVAWQDGRTSSSSWLTPEGTTLPRDYKCDIYTSADCRS